MGFIRGCVRYAFMAYFKLFYKIDEIGRENIPKKGAYILCSNHIHWLDPVLYVCETPRMVYAVGKEELFSKKIKSFVMRRLGVIPINREVYGDNKNSLGEAERRINEGNLFLIYPEGTRFGFKKGVRPKKGIALIAMETKVPIIPMAMVGSFKPFTKIRFKIDKPMDISEFYLREGEKPNLRNMVTLTNKVVDRILELRDSINTPEIEAQMNEAEEKRERKKALKEAKKQEKLQKIEDKKLLQKGEN